MCECVCVCQWMAWSEAARKGGHTTALLPPSLTRLCPSLPAPWPASHPPAALAQTCPPVQQLKLAGKPILSYSCCVEDASYVGVPSTHPDGPPFGVQHPLYALGVLIWDLSYHTTHSCFCFSVCVELFACLVLLCCPGLRCSGSSKFQLERGFSSGASLGARGFPRVLARVSLARTEPLTCQPTQHNMKVTGQGEMTV